MAIFGFKKKKEDKKKTAEKTVAKTAAQAKPKEEQAEYRNTKTKSDESAKDLSRVLLRPRVTEKATMSAENGVYVFEVDLRAAKKDIARAVEHYYGAKPLKVSVVSIPAKEIFSRRQGKRGKKSRGKKAYVYLKEGEKIEVI
jgi:large subunit ribosomal protein L23